MTCGSSSDCLSPLSVTAITTLSTPHSSLSISHSLPQVGRLESEVLKISNRDLGKKRRDEKSTCNSSIARLC
jgi:hypothetical protein